MIPEPLETLASLYIAGMAGVYDISKHYEYEKSRGVACLSTMERAIGGQENFEAQSPFQLLHKESNENTNLVDTTGILDIAENGIATECDRIGILSGSLDTATFFASHQNEPENKIVQKSKRAISQVWNSTQLWPDLISDHV